MGGACWLSYYVPPVTCWQRNKRAGLSSVMKLFFAARAAIWIWGNAFRPDNSSSLLLSTVINTWWNMCRGLFSPWLSKIESERRSEVHLIERAGEEELRLGASLSVSPVSMRTCQSIHICIDLLSVPSVQDQTLGRRHTHTFRQRNVLSVVRWSLLLWRVLFLKRLCAYIIAFLLNSVYGALDLFPAQSNFV